MGSKYISLHVNLIDFTSSQIRENRIIIHKCGRFMDGVYLITCFPSSNCKPPEWLGWKGLISRETKNLSFQLIPVANLPKMGYQNAWIRYEKAGLPIGQQTLPSIEQPKVGAKKKRPPNWRFGSQMIPEHLVRKGISKSTLSAWMTIIAYNSNYYDMYSICMSVYPHFYCY